MLTALQIALHKFNSTQTPRFVDKLNNKDSSVENITTLILADSDIGRDVGLDKAMSDRTYVTRAYP